MAADPFASFSDGYVAHSSLLRGRLRHELVARQLLEHLPAPPCRILDAGGGHGEQAVRVARAGHDVVLLDPSARMLEQARARLEQERPAVAARVELVEAAVELLPSLRLAPFDTVLCHGVLMYMRAPSPAVAALLTQLRPGGVLSLLVKNRSALALRPGLEGRYREALASFETASEQNRLGAQTYAHSLADVGNLLAGRAEIVAWYGVRVFTDHLGEAPPSDVFEDALAAELRAGRTDPYRAVARLLHVIAVKSE
jgi:S-adenosylmethionine-dependent methyltransferase